MDGALAVLKPHVYCDSAELSRGNNSIRLYGYLTVADEGYSPQMFLCKRTAPERQNRQPFISHLQKGKVLAQRGSRKSTHQQQIQIQHQMSPKMQCNEEGNVRSQLS